MKVGVPVSDGDRETEREGGSSMPASCRLDRCLLMLQSDLRLVRGNRLVLRLLLRRAYSSGIEPCSLVLSSPDGLVILYDHTQALSSSDR